MSSLSWHFPPPSTSPQEDGDGAAPEAGLDGHEDGALVDLVEQERLEREQLERLEREHLAQLEREHVAQLDQEIAPPPVPEEAGPEQAELEQAAQRERAERERAERADRERAERADRELAEREHAQAELAERELIEAEERSEREQLEALEREHLRRLEALDIGAGLADFAGPPELPPAPAPAEPAPAEPAWRPPFATAASSPDPEIDAHSRASQLLAAANARLAEDDAIGDPWPEPDAGRIETDEPARAARAIVDHRHQSLVEANALLTEARRTLAPIAYRGISDRTYIRRKIILAIGEAVSLAIAFSAAFDVAPLEALLLSGAIALAFVVAGDLGGILRITAERSRLSAALEDGSAHLDPRYLHIVYHDRQPWLSIVGGVTAGVFGVAAVSVGVLRAASEGSFALAAGLGLLTISLAIAAGLSSWQHASLGSEIIDHLQREEEAAARRLKRAAAARALRRPGASGTWRATGPRPRPASATGAQWPPALGPAPQVGGPPGGENTWEIPELEPPSLARRPKRERGTRKKAPKPDGGPGRIGMAAAKTALLMARMPTMFRRRPKQAAEGAPVVDDDESGPGPGAGGESAGPIDEVSFTPPINMGKRFP